MNIDLRGLRTALLLLLVLAWAAGVCPAQAPGTAKAAEKGSQTAKGGFKNEDEIRDKFNNWQDDLDARKWLETMGFRLEDVIEVAARKPHGEKSDVDVVVRTKTGERKEGISIKLVSSPTGFNQIDKRWLATYVRMWKIPTEAEAALKLFLGEVPPVKPGRAADRMFLTELDEEQRRAVIEFFTANKDRILRDLFRGDGPHAATWFMVAQKGGETTRWVLVRDEDAIRFFGEGKIEITRGGNLKIGRVTMQRKGGDGGRETARMLQFKINPALLFDAK